MLHVRLGLVSSLGLANKLKRKVLRGYVGGASRYEERHPIPKTGKRPQLRR